ncbi:Leucine rich repeat protein bspa family [Entamoeba marina]
MNNDQLDSYSILICSKYLKSPQDFINLMCVNSKFKETTKKLRFNPIQITSLKLFPNIQTQYLYERDDIMIKGIDNYEILYYVDYDQYLKYKQDNIKCHHIIYTNREKYDNKIPDGVTILSQHCFGRTSIWRNDASDIKEITIPSTIKSLSNMCFWDCTSLQSVKLPSTLISLGDSCFSNCSALTSINLPVSLKSIGKKCFYCCSSLTSIDLPSTLTTFGEGCFFGCPSLKSILNIPGHCFNDPYANLLL